MFDLTCKLNYLQAKCKEYNLPTTGKNVDLVKRLNNYLKSQKSNESDNNDENADQEEEEELVYVPIGYEREIAQTKTAVEICDEEDEEDSEDMFNQNGKRVKTVYLMDKQFEKLELAVDCINSEKTWSKERSRQTKEGLKDFYRCKVRSCKSKMYILFHEEEASVSIWRNNAEHNHADESRIKNGINEVTKKQIELLVKNGINTASRIILALKDRLNPIKAKRSDSDPDVENKMYIPGLEIPSLRQLNNYLNNNLRPKLNAGYSSLNFIELEEWVDKHKRVPDSEHEPFLINSYIELNEKIPALSIVRICISTKAILKLAMKTNHICADSTNKLTWHNFSVFLTGLFLIEF